jgi:FkbM family methyltransferase
MMALRRIYQTLFPLSARNSLYRLRARFHKALLPIIAYLPFTRGAEGMDMPSATSKETLAIIAEIQEAGGIVADGRHHEKSIIMGGVHIDAETHQDIFIVNEVFAHKLYDIRATANVVVLDVGMNVGIASLAFAATPLVEHVYGYELFVDTYERALKNIGKNPELQRRISTFAQGLWNKNERKTLRYNYRWKASLGLFAPPEFFRDSVSFVQRNVELVDAAQSIQAIKVAHPNSLLIGKLDCEGAEYVILERWHEANLINAFAGFMIEWHSVDGKTGQDFFALLEQAGFVLQHTKDSTHEFGMVYAVHSKYVDSLSLGPVRSQ